MPPKRRSTGATASSRNQSTLSFNNKSRVTKQSNILPPSTDKKATKRLSEEAKAELIEQISEPEAAKPEVAELPASANTENQTTEVKAKQAPAEEEGISTRSTRRKTKKSTSTGYEARVKEAERITDAKIKSYWKAEEDNRLAPRVHQRDVHLHEKILRHFDLSSEYGPCIGIPRLERWKRASKLGMEPPIEVLAVLLKEEKKGADKGVGERQCGQLAYIDELAGGRVVLIE